MRAAQQQGAVFIALEREGPRWRIKADTLTAPGHAVESGVYDSVQEAIGRLIRTGQVHPGSYAGPACLVLHDVDSEQRARELAAALHAALYGDPAPWPAPSPGP
ncbi:hypothetical protein [Streptomyces hydrogenans]|uniref:hypothetical protein n=1 Tax=Streptomyces hydrogenans TaxID=1873719 RepID=UPI0033F4D5C0